jgi:hypothetical protein
MRASVGQAASVGVSFLQEVAGPASPVTLQVFVYSTWLYNYCLAGVSGGQKRFLLLYAIIFCVAL